MAIVTYSQYTNGSYSISLPQGITEFSYSIMGAGGGGSGSDAGSPGATGGTGAALTGTATVSSGATINIYVGGGGGGGASSQGGAPGGAGGTNGTTTGTGGGGGRAGNSGSSGGGGGGAAATYLQVTGGEIIAIAGGGGGAGGAGNDGSGPSNFQFGGNGGTSLSSGTTTTVANGSNASDNSGDGGAGGGGGGGRPGGSAGSTPSSDSDASGGAGGGSWYNTTFHSSAPSASNSRPSDLIQGGSGGGQSTAGSNGGVYIAYDDIDEQPNNLNNFGTQTNRALSTAYDTDTEQPINGINQTVPASVTGGTGVANGVLLIKNGTVLTGTTTTVVNGDSLGIRMISASSYNTEANATLTVGPVGQQVTATFKLITGNAPNNIPNSFDFTDVTQQPLDTDITSNAVTISGLTQQASITTSGSRGGSSVTVTALVNGTAGTTINNGDTLALRVNSGSTVNTATTASVTVGAGSAVDWQVTSITSQDTQPAAFDFIDATGQINTVVTSNTQTIQGINTPAALTISSAPASATVTYSINGGAFQTYSAATTITNLDTLALRVAAPSSAGNAVTVTTTVGSAATGQTSDQWRVVATDASDTVPDLFTLTPRTNQLENTQVYSNIVVPTGFNATATSSARLETVSGATNAQIRLNNVWTNLATNPSSTPFNFDPGDNFQLRLTTGSYGSSTAQIRVTIGGVSVLWNVSVLASAPTANDVSVWYSQKTEKLDGLAIGSVITIFKDPQGNWGTLDGSLTSRYPGFIECNGDSLDADEYPDLFDVIGNDYGGSGTRTLSSTTQGTSTVNAYSYSGSFTLPDFRNRRLFGTGSVDGNVGSAPSAPTRVGPAGTGTGGVNTVGSVGGDWYIDTVDAAGTPPLEQVEGTGTTGTTGQFFSLGTVNTSGLDTSTATANFNVAGNMNATVGPLDSPVLQPPGHSHAVLTGIGLNVTTGLIPWNHRGTPPGSDISGTNQISSIFPGAPNAPTLDNIFSTATWSGSVTYSNYWASSKENTLQLQNNSGNQLGAIDVVQATGQGRIYSPQGGMLTHSHYLSLSDFGDPVNVYGWGNVNGGGTKTTGMGGGNTVDVPFSHTELGTTISPGLATLSAQKALLPGVALRPNRTIPLLQPFFKCKYLIKAY